MCGFLGSEGGRVGDCGWEGHQGVQVGKDIGIPEEIVQKSESDKALIMYRTRYFEMSRLPKKNGYRMLIGA